MKDQLPRIRCAVCDKPVEHMEWGNDYSRNWSQFIRVRCHGEWDEMRIDPEVMRRKADYDQLMHQEGIAFVTKRPPEFTAERPADVLRERMTRLPRPGTPVAELTERDKLAIAFHVGVPCSLAQDGTTVTLKTDVPCSVADRGDGGYIVAQSVPMNRRKW